MRPIRFLLACLVALAAPHAFAASDPPPPLTIAADGTGITVANVTSTSGVVLLGITLQTDHGVLTSREILTTVRDDDGDRSIRYTPSGGVPLRSIFMAIDRASGAVAFGCRPDYTIDRISVPSASLKKNEAGEIIQLLQDRISADMVVVRPAGGAWALRAFEGGAKDADKLQNGHLVLAFDQADPLDTGGDKLKHLKNGDVVAVIDPGHMQAFAVTIGN